MTFLTPQTNAPRNPDSSETVSVVTRSCDPPDYLANPSAKTTEIRCVFGGETLLSYVAGAGLVCLSFLLNYAKHFFFSVLEKFLV
jgi:hypothetical protein